MIEKKKEKYDQTKRAILVQEETHCLSLPQALLLRQLIVFQIDFQNLFLYDYMKEKNQEILTLT